MSAGTIDSVARTGAVSAGGQEGSSDSPRKPAQPGAKNTRRCYGDPGFIPGPHGRGPVVSQSERDRPMCGIVGYVGKRPAQESAARGPRAARVPRLRLGRHLGDRRRRRSSRCAPSATSPPCARPSRRWRRRRRASPSPPASAPSASATRAGPRTAGSTRRTPTRTTTRPTACTSWSTASSRTTSRCASA